MPRQRVCQTFGWAMRHGRLKRIRRALTFYKVCHQFREPYKARTTMPGCQREAAGRAHRSDTCHAAALGSGAARRQLPARVRVPQVRAQRVSVTTRRVVVTQCLCVCVCSCVAPDARTRLGDVRQAVAKLLGAPVRVFVTKCVQAELQSLGQEYSGPCWHCTPPCVAAKPDCECTT